MRVPSGCLCDASKVPCVSCERSYCTVFQEVFSIVETTYFLPYWTRRAGTTPRILWSVERLNSHRRGIGKANRGGHRAVESHPRTGEEMMAICERRMRFADRETQDQGMSKKWQNGGFLGIFPDSCNKSSQMDTQNH